ncbi:secretin N-terminal domain-containing protein [Cupriavidus pauculus]|uniref:secretin N-terminal domain-containing protein n=1 Tax=Cupriavidus pauculus TaxID=82633 RepID=UPI001EE2758F|nr:secretin N-terminal domain-containing protein [Cupriavidus pauculus]GJG96668.1 general secretion pathway protein GspD [Cupriavidus pauculus]
MNYETHGGARLLRRVFAIACLALATACAQPPVAQDARKAFDQGKIEESLAQLRAALAANPTSTELQVTYLSLRERAINDLMAQERALAPGAGSGERTQLLRRVLAIDPNNARAVLELDRVDREVRYAKMQLDAQFAFDAKDNGAAMAKARAILAEDPNNAAARGLIRAILDKSAIPASQLAPTEALQRKVSIQFKDALLKQVFDVLSVTSGINFVLDKDIKADQKTSVFLKDVTVKSAIEVVLATNQLEQKVINASAILIYPNLPAKLKDYQALSVHTFYLNNVTAEQMAATLKSILKVQNLVVDKTQNMIMMRDTPDVIEMAEKVVALQDLPTPETMLEVAVLEVNKNRLDELGITYPPKLTLTPLPATAGGALTLNDLRNLTASTIGATISPLTINLTGTDTDVKLLANPKIRVKNREPAKILIGNKVPNITSTATSTGFVSESIQYLDVGLKVEVTPTITIDNEVSIKVALEVSNIANQITTSTGTVAYQIGTRSASTVLRLKDGETQILAGLISDEHTQTVTKIPGLGDIPVLGRLFSDHANTKKRTEIVLSITPRLIRNPLRPEARLIDFASGTESSLRGVSELPVGGAAMPVAAEVIVPPTGAATSEPVTPAGTRGSTDLSGNPLDTNAGAAANGSMNMTGTAAAALGAGTGIGGGAGTGVGTGTTPGLTWSGATQATAGTSVQQQLMLSTQQPLRGTTLMLGYDPAALQLLNVAEGTALGADGTQTSFSHRVDASTGQIFVSDTRAPGATAGATGQGPLVTLTFMPLKATASTQLRVLSVTPTGFNGASVSLPSPVQTLTISGGGQ